MTQKDIILVVDDDKSIREGAKEVIQFELEDAGLTDEFEIKDLGSLDEVLNFISLYANSIVLAIVDGNLTANDISGNDGEKIVTLLSSKNLKATIYGNTNVQGGVRGTELQLKPKSNVEQLIGIVKQLISNRRDKN